ncbi:MAG: hypothetical protein WCE20_00265 [Rhizomicrobium sp.]
MPNELRLMNGVRILATPTPAQNPISNRVAAHVAKGILFRHTISLENSILREDRNEIVYSKPVARHVVTRNRVADAFTRKKFIESH